MIPVPARLRSLLALCLLLLAPPAHAAEGDAAAPPQLLDRFDVGRDVYVRSLLVDARRGQLWVGTSSGALAVDLASQQPLHSFTRDDGLANEYVFALGQDRAGDIWFGTNAGGASRYRDGEWDVFFPMHGLADYWIYAFAQQANGDFWIGTWAGVNRVRDLDEVSFETFVAELINEWVYGIAVDAGDRVWFGTEGGISMYDGERWRHWTHADGLGAANAAGAAPSENTGLGTRSRHDLSVSVQSGESYNPSYVFAVHAASDGRIWAGTWGGGISWFDGEQWHNLTRADGLAGNVVYSIAETADGALWFGTDAGISRYADGRFSSYSFHEGLPDGNVYALAVAPGGDLWAGTRGAVVRIGQAAPAGAADGEGAQ